MASPREVLEIAGREVTITNPQKVYFPASGLTKGEVVRYYLAVAEGALRGVRDRPMALKRYVNGIDQQAFYQKRAPDNRPEWIDTVELKYPSGRSAHEIVLHDAAALAWVVNLGCIDLHPHPIRAGDLNHPDELRIDLDPIPGVGWDDVRRVALVVRDVMADYGLTGWPKVSGSRGFHIYARVHPRWTFVQVRSAGIAIAREVEHRVPQLATSRWWKEERHGVFIDYNQNAKDRTTASAYSIRPTPDARVSAPLRWDEVADCDPADYTIATVLERYTRLGDLAEGIDESAGDLTALLELAQAQADAGADEVPDHIDPRDVARPRAAGPSRSSSTAETARSAKIAGSAETARSAKSAGSTETARSTQTAGMPMGGTTNPADAAQAAESAEPTKISGRGLTGRRASTKPLIEIARSATVAEAMAGLERWKARHPEVWPQLRPADVLVDSMRGRSSTWSRIRINLEHVPPDQRPAQEPLEVDFDPWHGMRRPEGTESAQSPPP